MAGDRFIEANALHDVNHVPQGNKGEPPWWEIHNPRNLDYTEIMKGPVPKPPFWGISVHDLNPALVTGEKDGGIITGRESILDVFPYINEIALFRTQWGYHRGTRTRQEYSHFVEQEVRPKFDELKRRAISENLLAPKVVYGYFPCQADRKDLLVWPAFEDEAPVGKPVRFRFPRQPRPGGLCIANYFQPISSGLYDTVAFQVVTMGSRAREYEMELWDDGKGDYLSYFLFHGFVVEATEALAEYWHKRVRKELSIGGKDAKDMSLLFKQGYQGSRYSFGYPACPDLEEQAGIVKLLNPARIGVELNEDSMWDPEATTSAIIVHHPEARYFVIPEARVSLAK